MIVYLHNIHVACYRLFLAPSPSQKLLSLRVPLSTRRRRKEPSPGRRRSLSSPPPR